MTEDNAIVPQDAIASAMQVFDDNVFDSLAVAGQAFLPRLMLCGANSDATKEGKVPMGHYGVFDQSGVTPVGDELDVLVCAWQPKAMRIDGDEVLSFIDPQNAEFKKIQEESNEQDSGCLWGFEFLLYIPEQTRFVSYLMGSKTARREAPNMKALMGRAATLKSKLIKNKRYSWHGPVVVPCSSPYDAPDVEEIKDAAKKFQAVSGSDVETVAGGEGERAR